MLFSIITVTLNNREGLAKTALSLTGQEYNDFEWIIIDGNSEDGTEDDFENYDALIISEDDEGVYDAMNKGIENVTGDYLIFLNAGDIFAQSQTLRKIYDAIRFSKPDFVYGDSWELSQERTWYKPARSHIELNKGMFTHHQSMVYKRALVDDQRYDLNYTISADYDFTIQFLSKAQTCLYLPTPISVFASGGISQQKAKLGRKEQFAIRRKNQTTYIPKNAAIYAAQTVSWSFRSCAPGLYWRLKNLLKTEPPSQP